MRRLTCLTARGPSAARPSGYLRRHGDEGSQGESLILLFYAPPPPGPLHNSALFFSLLSSVSSSSCHLRPCANLSQSDQINFPGTDHLWRWRASWHIEDLLSNKSVVNHFASMVGGRGLTAKSLTLHGRFLRPGGTSGREGG